METPSQELFKRIRLARETVQAWLADAAARVDPVKQNSPGELLFRRKCFNELALYLMWQERLPHRQLESIGKIRHLVAAGINDDYVSMALRRPERLLMYSCALGYAVHSGLLDQRQVSVVRQALSGPYAWSLDSTVFRQLDLVLGCHYAAVAPPLDPADLFKVSALALPPSPIYGDRDAFYAVTHAAFYQFLLPDCAGATHPGLALSVKGALCRALACNDLDLGLELIMVQLIHGIEPGAESFILLDQLLTELLTQGCTVGRKRSIDVAAFLAVCPEEAEWAEKFHAMLVAGLALLLLEEFGSAAWRDSAAREREGAMAMGSCLSALHQYHLVSGLAHLNGLDAQVPLDAGLMAAVAAFVRLNQRRDGHFGHLVDEMHKMSTSNAQIDMRAVLAPVDLACETFLRRYQEHGHGA